MITYKEILNSQLKRINTVLKGHKVSVDIHNSCDVDVFIDGEGKASGNTANQTICWLEGLEHALLILRPKEYQKAYKAWYYSKDNK